MNKFFKYAFFMFFPLIIASCGSNSEKNKAPKALFSSWTFQDTDPNSQVKSVYDMSNTGFGSNREFSIKFINSTNNNSLKCIGTANITGTNDSGSIEFVNVRFEKDADTSVSDADAVVRCASLNNSIAGHTYDYTLSNNILKICNRIDPSDCEELK